MKTILLLICLLAAFTKNVKAQQKIAYVHFDSVLMMMPEKIKADSVLYIENEKFERELIRREKKISESLYEYNKLKESVDSSSNIDCGFDIEELKTKLENLKKNKDVIIKELQEELYHPCIMKLQKATEMVAKEKQYVFVYNAGRDCVLFSTTLAIDITSDVKKKLGIK